MPNPGNWLPHACSGAARGAATLFLVLFVLAAACPAWAQQAAAPRPAVITVVSDDNYPPYIFRGDSGELMGILVDQWRAFEETTGVRVRLQAMDWAKAQEQMRQGGADVIDTMFRTEEREKVYAFSKPYARLDVPVYVHKSLGGIGDVKALRGFTIGVKAGDAVVEELRRYGIHSVKEYGSYKAVIAAAAQGDIRVFSVDGPPAVHHLYKMGLEDEFRQAFVLYSGEFHRAVRKSDPAMLRLVEEGFAAIPPATLERIDQRWLGAPLGGTRYLRELLLGLAGLGALFLALAGFSITLRRRVKAATGELNAALAALGESEERFRTIYNSVSDLIFIHAWPGGEIVDVNQRACDTFGYSREEMLRLTPGRLSLGTPPYDEEHAMETLGRAFEGQQQVAEWRARRRDGSLFWLEISVRRALVLGQERILVSCRDISERKAAEEALSAGQRRFAELIRYSSDSITILDEHGTQIFVSDVVQQMLGYAPAELTGIPVIRDMIHPEDQQGVTEAFAAILRNGQGGTQYRHRRKDGGWVHLEAWGTNQLDNPDIRGVVVNVRDITERKRAEQQLADKEALLQAMLRNLPFDFWARDREERIIMQSRESVRLWGDLSPGQGAEEQIPAGYREAWRESNRRVLDGETLVEDVAYDAGQGERRYQAIVAPIQDGERVLGIMGINIDITERVQAEQSLRESENTLRSLFASMTDVILILDRDGRYLEIAPTSTERLFMPPESLLGRTVFEVFPEPMAEYFLSVIRQALQTGRTVSVDYRLDISGRECWFSGTVSMLSEDSVIWVARDITERKGLEQRLAESEQHFRILANTGQALIWTCGTDKKCNYFNGPWLEFTGRSLEQELGDGWAEGVHPEDIERCMEIFVNSFDRRESFSMEYRLRHRSGEHRWIIDQGTPRYDAAGNFLGYIGHCLDIHEKRQSETVMRQQRRMLQTILNTLPQAVFWKDRRSVYLGCNSAFAADAGLEEPQGVVGLTDLDLPFRPEDAEAYRADDEAVMSSGQAKLGFEEQLRRSDGSVIWLETSKLPLMNEAGEAVGVIGIYEDITARRRVDEELRQSRKAADDANRAKSEFLANMSHEIRTPLNGVLGMIELLKATPLEPEQEGYLGKAHEAARRLLTLLNDILDFSKIEAGRMALARNVFGLDEVFETVDNVLGGLAERKGLTLSLSLDPSLPPLLVGDDARLRQVLLNLVGNALKFTCQGGVAVSAWRIPTARDASLARLCLLVSDTGPGIPDDKVGFVFERFTQTDGSYARQYEGAGLGLAIVKRIVGLLGGEISVDSEPGRGTDIYLSLSLGLGAGPRPAPPPQPVAPAGASLRILLADDEPIGLLAMRVQLERLGHSVTAVANGREVLEALAVGQFDCVLMDIQMPEMDGVEATRRIRAATHLGDKSRVPIIALTAYAMEGDREKFLAAGLDGHVAKPVQAEALMRVLAVLGRGRD